MRKVALIGLVIALAIAGGLFLWHLTRGDQDHVRRPTAGTRAASRNNLLQIGLAFRIWAGDHNDQYPFNVSQAQGGTRELCDRDRDGFEKNPAPVFMVMSNELSTTKILVSPNYQATTAAASFATLTAKNISYKLRTGATISPDHPLEMLAVDPVNDWVLFADGSVQKGRR
jgi:hypothetical protein